MFRGGTFKIYKSSGNWTVLQAASILVAMRVEKNFGNLCSGIMWQAIPREIHNILHHMFF